MPVAGTITQEFKGTEHHGIDIACNVGSEVIVSREGTVDSIAQNDPIYGNVVLVGHGGQWQTLYAHLSKISVIKGQYVFSGGQIGLSGGEKGAAGAGNSKGAHLHFELRVGNQARDPMSYFK